MTKRFTITATSNLADLEFKTNDYDEAEAMYTQCANSTHYTQVVWTNGYTGEIYRHRDLKFEHGGVYRTEYQALPF